MTTTKILEAHELIVTGSPDAGPENWGAQCKCGAIDDEYDDATAELHMRHVAQVLEQHMQEREAAAVRETARYIERLFPRKGLVNRADILADIEVAADRIGRGIHANGRDKNTHGRE